MSNSHLPVRVLVPLPLSLSHFSLFSYLFPSRIAMLLSFFLRALIYLSIYLLPVYLPLCYLSFPLCQSANPSSLPTYLYRQYLPAYLPTYASNLCFLSN